MVMDSRKIPREWARSDIILLYKKGDPTDVGNYRPISLQPSMYKLFASCLERRLSKYTEEYQPVEQAGFRRGFSTIDHIHALDMIIEKYIDQNCPLYLGFVDYAKAFDTISHKSMWQALGECNVPYEIIELIQNIYQQSVSRVKLDRIGPEIKICRGVRQGDPLSPRIFITVLQSVMKTLQWEKKGIEINGQYLSNLRFADDIVIFSNSATQLQDMLNELVCASKSIGLEMNTSKTKVMTNSKERPIFVNATSLEYVQNYIYLGKQISFSQNRHVEETNRRVNLAWNKYWALKEVLKSNHNLTIKRTVMDTCILPCLSYGCQTWIFNKALIKKIGVCQRAMERSILQLKLKDKIKNKVIRSRTKIKDVVTYTKRLKWKWAGHIGRICDGRWVKKTLTWKGPVGRRKRGCPPKTWEDDIKGIAGKNWKIVASNRDKWKNLEEAFTPSEVEYKCKT
ncbi:unnamed protein product [Pieris macdunnoughi]|uniref:Reverse transcriptase domain-containing protein n=1 Tax=Pieris macdunnoughi TaxID=345717 RepID=A0A821UEW9_9NEOP|nr:unnamed protein product [Pieris macdunnoughi]